MPTVLDSSALIAAINNEPGADTVRTMIDGAVICATNYAEVIGVLMRHGTDYLDARRVVGGLGVIVEALDAELAARTGQLEVIGKRFGLSLGDRSCLALAERLDGEAWTADRRWLDAELPIKVKLIR